MRLGDVCLLKDPDAFRAEWRLAIVTATFPDKHGNVRNVEVRVASSQDKSKDYKPTKPNHLKRHVSNLVVIVPVEADEKEDDAEEVRSKVKEKEADGKEDDDEEVRSKVKEKDDDGEIDV